MGSRIGEEALRELIGKIYEAAVDPDRWPDFLERFARAMNSGGTMIWVHDFAGHRTNLEGNALSFGSSVRFDPAYLASLASYYSDKNVWVQNEEALRPGVPVNSSMLYPDCLLPTTEWYNDWLRPQQYRYAIGGLVLKEQTQGVKFTSVRPERQGEFDRSELWFYAQLLPHLRRACDIHRRMATVRVTADSALRTLDLLPMGVWIFDARGFVIVENRAAKQLATRESGLWLDREGRPRAQLAGEEQQLRALLLAAIRTGNGAGADPGGAMNVHRARGLGMLHVLVSPLGARSSALPVPGCAACFISDPAARPASPEQWLTQLYGLTRAEAQLAAGLVAGKELRRYAEERQVSINTVRTQLRCVLEKTGARRQSDLIRIVLGGSISLGGAAQPKSSSAPMPSSSPQTA